MQSQPPDSLSKVQSHSPKLPPIQEPGRSHTASKQNRNEMVSSGQADHAHAPNEVENDKARSRYARGEVYQSRDDRQEVSRHSNLPKPDVTKTSNLISANGGQSHSRAAYSESRPSIVNGRDHLHATRENGNKSAIASPNAPRPMAMREIIQIESREKNRHVDNAPRRDRSLQDGARLVSRAPNGHPETEKPRSPQRLAATNAIEHKMSGGAALKAGRNDGKSSRSPSVPLQNANVLRPICESENEKQLAQTSSGPSTSIGLKIGSLPPLSSRGAGSVSGTAQNNKEVSGGHSSGLGLASSLTKFSKGIVHAPSTPVNNSVAPPSLPSPLPMRKSAVGSSSMSSISSPRSAKPNMMSGFSSIPIPPAGYDGATETVPSPSSLPVLPALSSRGGGGEEGMGTKEKERWESSREKLDKGQDKKSRCFRSGSRDSPKEEQDVGKRSRKSEDGLSNKNGFSLLRCAPARNESKVVDSEKCRKEDRVVSPSEGSVERKTEHMGSTNKGTMSRKASVPCMKRSGIGREEGVVRIAKRPRLQDGGEKDDVSKSYSLDTLMKPCQDTLMKPCQKGTKDECEDGGGGGDERGGRGDDNGKRSFYLSGKSDKQSIRGSKGELRGGESAEMHGSDSCDRGESGGRNDEEIGKESLAGQAQVIEVTRVPSAGAKASGGCSLGGNRPLPSFRTERLNLSASRCSNGCSSGGKTCSHDGGRGSVGFSVRSTGLGMSQLSVKGRGSSSNRGGDRTEETTSKHVKEDKIKREERGGVDGLGNGESNKAKMKSGDMDVRSANDLGPNEEKPKRAEIRST